MGTADSVARKTRTPQNASSQDRLLFLQAACTEMALVGDLPGQRAPWSCSARLRLL